MKERLEEEIAVAADSLEENGFPAFVCEMIRRYAVGFTDVDGVRLTETAEERAVREAGRTDVIDPLLRRVSERASR